MGPVQEISQWPKVSKFAVSACAASVAELVTFPLDLTKTRLQIQGEYAPEKLSKSGTVNTVYRGMLSTAVGIVREEGPLKLWQGATPAIYRHIVYSGGRMLAYEQLRDFVLGKSEDGSFPLCRVHGVIHGFVKIAKEGGIRGLWAGWVPNVQRAALVNLGDLTTYDSVKHILLRNTSIEDNCLCHGLASTCSGLVAAMMGTPADVVKTRIMNQPLDSNGRGLLYKSSIDCLVQSVRAEGLRTLYKGFVPTWLRMAPWSMTFWLTFEQIRHAVGISSF
ncbi:mitochondrial uncoupling protein 4 isoform X4 [Ictalurus punctatus]|uniref:Mitochondrial uncoupling protein 4 isoform X4 n=1 Tax=Ictalurus punctatus TaxID=7998 RepID=A0A2D0R190_ICTPU|nr:mitochondrial uncoupling protein 4 isoform X4 [Ictalurus punctatus]